MGGYIGSSVGNLANAAERKQTYSITTATTSLTGLAYTPTKVHVFHNGVRLVDGTDYTATNGTSITLTNAAQNGDEVVVISYPSFQTSDTVSAANGGTFAGNVTISNDLLFEGDIGADGCIKKNNTTNRDEMQIYSGSDAYSTGSRGAGIHLYGNSDTQHDGDIALLTGPDDNGDARLMVSGREDKAHVTIGNSIWDYVDDGLDHALLNLKGPSSQPALLIEGASGTEGDIVTPDGEAIQIGHWNKSTSTFTERMRISSNGYVGLGTSPSYPLEVSLGQSDAAARFARGNTNVGMKNLILFRSSSAGADVGSIQITNSATSYVTSSDHRLKENVETLSNGITRVKQLQPKRFSWIIDEEDSANQDGFLAHEAQTVVPEAVTGTHNEVDDDGNPVHQGIDQAKLVPLLTAALQEAIAKIEDLETRVAALEAE